MRKCAQQVEASLAPKEVSVEGVASASGSLGISYSNALLQIICINSCYSLLTIWMTDVSTLPVLEAKVCVSLTYFGARPPGKRGAPSTLYSSTL